MCVYMSVLHMFNIPVHSDIQTELKTTEENRKKLCCRETGSDLDTRRRMSTFRDGVEFL